MRQVYTEEEFWRVYAGQRMFVSEVVGDKLGEDEQ